MKKPILLILCITLLSCWGPERDFYRYTVKNETGKNIKIKSYLSNYPSVSPLITNLSIGEELTKTYRDDLPPVGYRFSYFFGEENGSARDSLVIIYNNLKESFFNDRNCINIRNPLNFCEYGGLEETFIFTEQDYENAEDCNGNCE